MLRLGVGDEALSDAEACIRLRPDWAKGYYRQGMAYRLLEVMCRKIDSEVQIELVSHALLIIVV